MTTLGNLWAYGMVLVLLPAQGLNQEGSYRFDCTVGE